MPFRLAFFLGFLLLSPAASAQEKVGTCVQVEATRDREALVRLVASEVDRHRSHQAVTAGCSAHLKVELIDVAGGRFLTGRINGEVPQRVRVDDGTAKGLERAVESLLAIVLGNDPVVLRAPGGQSWFGDKALALRDHGHTTLDFAVLQSISLVEGRAGFDPGILVGLSREIADWQIGVEAMWIQGLEGHPHEADLDTEVRLQATVTHFLSPTADVSGFAGVSLGLAHQRFSGPRAPHLGDGEGVYHATGPALALRGGVEFFRTTALRAFALADVFLPVFVANDQESEITKGWVPGAGLGAGVRF